MLKKIAKENGIKIKEIKEKLEEIKISNSIKKVLELCKEKKKKIIIVSDANNLFIEWILKKNKIFEYFDEIITNPTEIIKEDGIEYIKVIKYMKHDCNNKCPENICKGNIIKKYIKNNKKLIYIGDGNKFSNIKELMISVH
jgi:2,3-diketo-5-methylthio-1-phosphopentane phosphatase